MYNEVIYEIYPLTFNYAPGSKSDPYPGCYGNLKGITAMVDYVASLGVDAVWIAPFFRWDRNGFGYDITDYYRIDPMFGTLDDFRELCAAYHDRGVKVFIDQVYNHCSANHPWFRQSIKKSGPYADYFVWHDAVGFDGEGKPVAPNNWPSKWDVAGESAWTWNEERRQFYLHSFDYTMPNLNINNPEVRRELLKISEYWFDLGADGFRLDATTHYGYDELFRNNPLDETGEQIRVYDINNRIGAEFLDALKALAGSYAPAKTLLAEYVFDKGKRGNDKGVQTVRESVCDSFYIGSLRGTLEDFRRRVTKALQVSPQGKKLNWAFSNHDMERAVTRLWGNDFSAAKSAMLMDLLLTLPGSICIFQGDELGMPNPLDLQACKNPARDPRDVWSIANNPWDGARTGFCVNAASHGNMALHPDERQISFCIEAQEKDPYSTLNQVREAIKNRRKSIFSRLGDITFLDVPGCPDVISFIRSDETGENNILCMYNFGETSAVVSHRNRQYVLPPETKKHEPLL